MTRLLHRLSALLVFIHVLRFKPPPGVRLVVSIDLEANYVVVVVKLCVLSSIMTFRHGTRGRQVESAILMAISEMDAYHQAVHGVKDDPEALDIGPFELRVPNSRAMDCGGGGDGR